MSIVNKLTRYFEKNIVDYAEYSCYIDCNNKVNRLIFLCIFISLL
ncbi:hypothetical protein PYS61_03320 [Amygdalobacter indicium]|uniref:Uncharacterized protein n=1 Tax=Amygdalobacter indicium TaxID=3029272 RepID=A0ABY8C2T6_9FIRM|nr:hypothetical protein [Amygdalobacter indicium]WEG34990.1 hypothetical protein PYS61_03320 [Amygdalobacter indicium]